MPTVAEVATHLKQFAPLALAGDWDNVGLLLGDSHAEVHRLMTCLTVTPETADEAIAAGVHLIVSHHPILFRAVQKLTTATAEGEILWRLARAGTAVFSPHSAFDNTRGGINDLLARRLGLVDVAPLRPRPAAGSCKIVVFLPEADLGAVADALYRSGAGRIGEYTECSYRLTGTGTFFGSDAANPTIGQKGRREEVTELRLEVVCPADRVNQAVAALKAAHSYEEPAFDVYPLQPLPSSAGEGRLGRLPQALSFGDFARRTREALQIPYLQVVGNDEAPVEIVALACGAAGEFVRDAVRANADVFLTGEMRFHDLLFAQAQGVGLLLPGHYATERPGVEELAVALQQQWPDLTIWASRTERDPLRLVGTQVDSRW